MKGVEDRPAWEVLVQAIDDKGFEGCLGEYMHHLTRLCSLSLGEIGLGVVELDCDVANMLQNVVVLADNLEEPDGAALKGTFEQLERHGIEELLGEDVPEMARYEA